MKKEFADEETDKKKNWKPNRFSSQQILRKIIMLQH